MKVVAQNTIPAELDFGTHFEENKPRRAQIKIEKGAVRFVVGSTANAADGILYFEGESVEIGFSKRTGNIFYKAENEGAEFSVNLVGEEQTEPETVSEEVPNAPALSAPATLPTTESAPVTETETLPVTVEGSSEVSASVDTESVGSGPEVQGPPELSE